MIPEFDQFPIFYFTNHNAIFGEGDIVVEDDHMHKLDFELEVTAVIGKRGKNIPAAEALQYVFGVTCGNDISERVWQADDVQWVRAKASDTFGPCGPYIVRGVDYEDLLLQMRVNGTVKQEQRTGDLVHGVAEIIRWASQHMTLEPGDLIYTGTPGSTTAIKPGDVLEVQLENVGTLTSRVVAE